MEEGIMKNTLAGLAIRTAVRMSVLFCLSALVACETTEQDLPGDDDDTVADDTIPSDETLAEWVAIDQGIYGLTTSHDDVGDNPVEIFPDGSLAPCSVANARRYKEMSGTRRLSVSM